jgi:hypothetical protein
VEPERFDRFVRIITTARSRRGMLGALGSGALAVGVGVARPQPAEARCRRTANCDKGRFLPCKDNDNPNCFRAKDVDTGRCACFIDSGCGDQCESGSDCSSGLCIRTKGCCNDTGKFCAEFCPTV